MAGSRDTTAGKSWRFDSPQFSVSAGRPTEVLSYHTYFHMISMLVNNGLHKAGYCLLGGHGGL